MFPARYEKLLLFLWPKKMETYFLSKAVVPNLGEEVPLDRPYHNKTRKKAEFTNKTNLRRIASEITWRNPNLSIVQSDINFRLIRSQVTQKSQMTFSERNRGAASLGKCNTKILVSNNFIRV